MAIAIGGLPNVLLDYTKRGTGLQAGMTQLEALLNERQGRDGYMTAQVIVAGGEVSVVFARADLYILGFRSDAGWYRFDEVPWPFSDAATSLGHDAQYRTLGGLTGNLTAGSIEGIARLADVSQRHQWRESLRTLVVVVSECARLIPVRMQVIGLLNGAIPLMPLGTLARYIQNWDQASRGVDMSQAAGPNLRTGFRDPTIIRR